MSPLSASAPKIFRLLARSPSRLAQMRRLKPEAGICVQAFAEADRARLSAFGSWQAISHDLRQRALMR